MQILINISEETYNLCKDKELISDKEYKTELWEAVANGTPLPKGHGDLVDIDELIKYMKDTRTYDIPFALAHIKPIIEVDRSEEE